MADNPPVIMPATSQPPTAADLVGRSKRPRHKVCVQASKGVTVEDTKISSMRHQTRGIHPIQFLESALHFAISGTHCHSLSEISWGARC